MQTFTSVMSVVLVLLCLSAGRTIFHEDLPNLVMVKNSLVLS